MKKKDNVDVEVKEQEVSVDEDDRTLINSVFTFLAIILTILCLVGLGFIAYFVLHIQDITNELSVQAIFIPLRFLPVDLDPNSVSRFLLV